MSSRVRLSPPEVARRRTRLRRVTALGGMLAVVGALVTVRSALVPAPSHALSSPGLASAVDSSSGASPSGASSSSSSSSSPRHRHASHRVSQVTGQAYDVGYGVVQVKISMQGKRITDVQAISLPQGGRSGDISSYAAPQLRREAISAQSARIDSVSGASYTSAGYAQSLQSALDRSGS